AKKQTNNNTINVVEKRTFNDVAYGKILSISKSNIEMSFSDPIKLEITINKKQGESAFALYKLFNPTNTQNHENLSLDFFNKNEKVSATNIDASLCSSTLTGSYHGLSFTQNEPFNRNYLALVFSPTRINDNSSAIEFLQCTDNALTSIKAYDLLENKEISSSDSRSLRVAFSSGGMNNYYKDKYNLQQLLSLVKDELVCVNHKQEGNIEFYWNKKKLLDKVIARGS
ncbi:MAG: hypothetical protein QXD98_04135, partial [Candidatus Diapherotrites archaeon]